MVAALAAGAAMLALFVRVPQAAVYMLIGLVYLQEQLGTPPFTGELPVYDDLPHVLVNVIEVTLAVLAVALVYRRVRFGERVFPARPPLLWPIGVFVAWSAVSLGIGMSQGGSLHDGLWEVRSPLYVPALFLATLATVRGVRAVRRVIALELLLTLWLGLVAMYRTLWVLHGQLDVNGSGAFRGSENMFFIEALLLGVCFALYGATRLHGRLALAVALPALMGFVFGFRRNAWVGMAVALVVLVVLLPPRSAGVT